MFFRREMPIAFLLLALAACQGPRPGTEAPAASVEVPQPPRAEQRPYTVRSPHGDRRDPWYWLRDDSRSNPEVLAYLKAENTYRDVVMAPHATLREQLFREITGRLDPDESTVPVLEHGYWYYRRYAPGQEFPVVARRKGRLDAPEEILLDGNARAAEGRTGDEAGGFYQLGETAVSPDGRLLAWTEDTLGRRQYRLRIRDVVAGRDLADEVRDVEPGVVWAKDNRTLFYVANEPVTLRASRVYRHVLGETRDTLVHDEKDEAYYLVLGKTRSEDYLLIGCASTEQTEWLAVPASTPDAAFTPIVPREPGHLYFPEHIGGDWILLTNRDAPDFRIVRAPRASPGNTSSWRDVLAHRPGILLEDFSVAAGFLAVNERDQGVLKLRIKPWSGVGERVMPAPEAAYSMQLLETPDINSNVVRYAYSSLVTPELVVDLDTTTGDAEERKRTEVGGGFDPALYASESLVATARDGARVPVSLVYRRDTRRDGTAPLYQIGYGSYGSSFDIEFRSELLSLLDRGFVVAIAHVRGGAERGRQWYEQGRLLNKQNTFDDFVDVTRYLVKQRFAARDRVFAAGGSAGGLLMGAIANQAPEDYRGIVAYVPFVDVLTTMLDPTIPLTTNEYDEWGDPRKKPFHDYMARYSPYDNVRAQNYPAMLVFTALWDSQVQYFEPAKWVAKLRATGTGTQPLVLSTDFSAGHGGPGGRFQQFRDTALEYAFILAELEEAGS
jgi:oligopeptidase B